jgi:CRP/FNR family cyclic AMP-dependent transcriptional regulator
MPIFEMLRREADVRTFAPGEFIFSEGEIGDCMFAVLDGEVEIRKGARVLESVGAGGVFGEMALIEHLPRSADAVAKTECHVAAVGERRFTLLVQQTPYFALQIMQVLAARLRKNTTS